MLIALLDYLWVVDSEAGYSDRSLFKGVTLSELEYTLLKLDLFAPWQNGCNVSSILLGLEHGTLLIELKQHEIGLLLSVLASVACSKFAILQNNLKVASIFLIRLATD